MAEPKCPNCDIHGIENIVSTPSHEKSRRGEPWFFVAHCDQCGHVYSVFARHVIAQGTGPTLVVPERRQ